MKNINKYVLYTLMGLGVIFIFLAMGTDKDDSSTWWKVDSALFNSYALVMICALLALVVGVLSIIGNPAKIKKTGISLGVLAAVFGLSMILGSDEIPAKLVGKENVTASVARWTDVGIWALYIFFIGTIGAIIYSTIMRFIK